MVNSSDVRKAHLLAFCIDEIRGLKKSMCESNIRFRVHPSISGTKIPPHRRFTQ